MTNTVIQVGSKVPPGNQAITNREQAMVPGQSESNGSQMGTGQQATQNTVNGKMLNGQQQQIPDGIGSNLEQMSKEHQQILAKEEEIMKQLEVKKQELVATAGQVEVDDSPSLVGTAIDLYMIMVKTYFLVLLNCGEIATKFVINTFLPDPIANEINNGTFDVTKIIPTLVNSVKALQDDQFRMHISSFFLALKDIIAPELKTLLNSISKIFADVATENSSKVTSIITNSLSAFPPAALVFDAASLLNVGISSMKSGLELAGASAKSVSDVQSTLPKATEEWTKAVSRLKEAGMDTSKIKSTLSNAATKLSEKANIDMKDVQNVKDKVSELGDKLKESLKTGAKEAVKMAHATSITNDEELANKQAEMLDQPNQNEKNKLQTDIDNYIKNKQINEQIDNKDGKLSDRALNFLETENVINKEDVNKRIESAKSAANTVGASLSNAAASAKDVGKSALEVATHALTNQPNIVVQQGGSIKQVRNLSKKISSRILKSLKDFSRTDRIKHNNHKHKIKTKRRKLHKHTKKRRS